MVFCEITPNFQHYKQFAHSTFFEKLRKSAESWGVDLTIFTKKPSKSVATSLQSSKTINFYVFLDACHMVA